MILYILLILFYFILVAGFLYLFFKNDKDLNKTFNYIKQNIFNCCIKNSLDGFSDEEKQEIKDNYKKSDEACKIKKDAANNAPFDLCIYPDDTPEIIATKNKVLKALRNMDNIIIDQNGNTKYIMPFEALAFLNYNLPPLVSEDGEIVIKKTDDNKNIEIISNQELIAYLEKIILFDEEGKQSSVDDLLADENIKESLVKIHKIKQKIEQLKPVFESDIDNQLELETLREQLKQEEEVLSKKVSNRRAKTKQKKKKYKKNQQNVKNSKEHNINSSIENDNNKQTNNVNNDVDEKSESELLNLDLSDIKKDLMSEEEENNQSKDTDISIDLDSSNELEDLLPDLLENKQETKNSNNSSKKIDRNDFYKNKLVYKNIPNLRQINFHEVTEFEDDLRYILENYWCEIVSNIAKSNKLIYSENKQNILIPFYSLAFGISKLYGADWLNIANNFDSLNTKASKKDAEAVNIAKTLIKVFNEFLDKYIVKEDLMVFNVKNTNNIGEFYYVNGRLCRMDMFKDCLSSDDINIFRSFPFAPNLKMVKDIDSNHNKMPLIQKVKDLEI